MVRRVHIHFGHTETAGARRKTLAVRRQSACLTWGPISVTARARVRCNRALAERVKIAFIDGSSANESKKCSPSPMRRRSQTEIKQEDTVRSFLTKHKKSLLSAAKQVPWRSEIGRRLKLQSLPISRRKALTTHSSFTNQKLLCCQPQANVDR